MKKYLMLLLAAFLLVACGGGIELTNKQNNAPIAQNDAIETLEDNNIIIEKLTANDIDADADELTISAFSSPAHGALSRTDDGNIQYTPNPDFFGEDSFDYSISDGRGGTHSASVTITVNGVNDAPTANNGKIAFTPDMHGALLRLTELNIVQDIDSNKLSFELIKPPTNAELSLTEDGTFIYTPAPGFEGDDKFLFRVSDAEYSVEAELTIQVTHVNDAPVAADDAITGNRTDPVRIPDVLKNDKDIDGDQLYVTHWTQPESGQINYLGNGEFEYTPNNETVSGIQSFEYAINDGNGAESTANVQIEIEAGWGHSTTHSLFSDWSSQVADEEGNITLVWTTSNKKGDLNLWARHYDNTKNNWLDVKQIGNKSKGTITATPEIHIDQNGTVFIFWQQIYNGFNALFTNRYIKKEGWLEDGFELSHPSGNTYADIAQPKIAIDDVGNIAVVWLQNTPAEKTYKIFYRRNKLEQIGDWAEIHPGNATAQIGIDRINSGSQTAIHASHGSFAIAWIDNSETVTGSTVVHVDHFSRVQNKWFSKIISREDSTLGIPSLPYFISDKDGNIDAFWTQSKPFEFVVATPVDTNYLWTSHINGTDNVWTNAMEVNTGGAVLSTTLITRQMKDTGNIFVTWIQTPDNTGTGSQTLWAITKTLDSELVPDSAVMISAQSEAGKISDIKLRQSKAFMVAIWLQENALSNNLWSNRLAVDDNGLLVQSQLDTIEFKDGNINSLEVIADTQQNLTAVWIQNVISPATKNTTISVMAQHFSNGYWLLKDASFVSTQLNIALNKLGTPGAIKSTTTPNGDVIVAWEHTNNLSTDATFNEIWTNTLEYSPQEPKWGTARQLNNGSNNDSHIQQLVSDKTGRVLSLWSEFSGIADHLFLRELTTVTSDWAPAIELGIDEQYDTDIISVNFNEDQHPTITGVNNSQTAGPRTLWSINYR
ncbi:MAG: cadherin-like domain-containing protein [Gammaproteobacteria bacterium]|nr:cadherin-like domain-containing protein [Gammaproteobacteria bacterium]